MIVFGWGHRTVRRSGPVIFQQCPTCGNSGWWVLATVRMWFTLFFIPVIPYQMRHLLLCPTCMRGPTLDRNGLATTRALMDLTAQLNSGAISHEEYQRRVAELTGRPASADSGAASAPTH